jgi:hypothetical protein
MTKHTSYHQGDINFYPLEAFGKKAADINRSEIIRTTDKRLLIQEGEITGHHHGCWFLPKPAYLKEDGAGHGGNSAAITDDVLRRAASGELAPARLYRDEALLSTLKLDATAPVIGFLVADESVTIRHASEDGHPTMEHADISLPAGGYLVTGKREWTAGDERRVED